MKIKSKLQEYKTHLKNKKVLIFGLGLQGGGIGTAKFFARNQARVKVSDLKTKQQLSVSLEQLKNYPIEYILGRHRKEDIYWADIIVVNPDVWNKNINHSLVNLAIDLGKKIETAMALFVELAECPVVGVTGTRGKTTTTVMINEILKGAGFETLLGGNIPDSCSLDSVDKTKKADFAVLELSNYQLHGFHLKKISPHIAVVTNIYPDHWVSYSSVKEYIHDKTAICRYQKKDDILVIHKRKCPGFSEFLTPGVRKEFTKKNLPKTWRLKVSGEHNRGNAAAAFTVAQALMVNKSVIKSALTNFKGVPFRLQKIAVKSGVAFVNDTTASTPTAATIALKSFPKGKIILIAGGNSKDLPIDEFAKETAKRIKYLVLLRGTGTNKFKKEVKKRLQNLDKVFLGEFDDLKKAVKKAYKNTSKGDIILFSPGFTSFAMWANEFERGREFNKIVKNLR